MEFIISKEDMEKFKKWDNDHNCGHKDYAGAIGGRLTYSFSPTRVGMIIKVICACGEECDLTDYDAW